MDTVESIKTRFSCRKFEPGTMGEDDLRLILEAGMAAPSAMNRRPYEFIVIRDQSSYEGLEAIKPTLGLFRDNPVSIVVVGDPGRQPGFEFLEQDIAAVSQNMLLMATALGYGSLWAGIPEGSPVQVELGKRYAIPAPMKAVVFLSFGKKGEHKEERPSRYEEAKIHFERF